MTMTVVDLSNHNATGKSKYLKDFPADAYIIKATEGSSFTDKYCDNYVQQAIKQGKPFGVYHFLNGENWKKQAKHFIKSCKGYFGKGLIALDYEMYGKQGSTVAKQWLDYVYQETGVRALFYTNQSTLFEDNWSAVAKNHALWIAYPSGKSNYPKIKYWKQITLHQYTFKPYDHSQFFGDKKAWEALAKGKKTNKEASKPSKKSITTIAKEVLNGKWSNGSERVQKLKKAGYDANKVQKEVNKLSKKDKTYIVKKNDTLSGIGKKLGVNWKTLAKKNNIKSPYTIYPKQTIKY